MELLSDVEVPFYSNVFFKACKRAAGNTEGHQESSINDFIGKINDVTARIETLAADCDVLINKLPGELALGTHSFLLL